MGRPASGAHLRVQYDALRLLSEADGLADGGESSPQGDTTAEFRVAATQRSYVRLIRVITGADGSPVGPLHILRDVTEEREAVRAKDDLMAAVSHELRTPLSSIVGPA